MKEQEKSIKKKKIIYKSMNADTEELRSYDLSETAKENTQNFATNYHDFYDDVKNTTKTEDW